MTALDDQTPQGAASASGKDGLSVREQIERYKTAFIAVVTMFIVAILVGGYILSNENLTLPSWVPFVGSEYFILKGEFETAQAVTPGQGQAVTIAGAKVGEVESVELHNGRAIVAMKVVPEYARFYKNATMLLRPKTQLQDITIEVNPGTAEAGKLHSGETIPVAQTAPNVDFDQFLAGLDADTRASLQLLLAGAAGGLKNNSSNLSAALKRFSPISHLGVEITRELKHRDEAIKYSIHNFRLITEALSGKDEQLSRLVVASNTVFKTFSAEDANVQRLLRLLPSTLESTRSGLGKLATASSLVRPTLTELNPFAKALAPAQQASQKLAKTTTPVFKNEIRPFAREILPVTNRLAPATRDFVSTLPNLTTSFGVLNEFFNELAHNPGHGKGGFLFFLPWANHDLNSVLSTADANGIYGRSLLYLNCGVLGILKPLGNENPSVKLLINLLRPPSRAECQKEGLLP
jgi:phospholipid/cholesterol/gamma-HCH transport system substrate-binding protein